MCVCVCVRPDNQSTFDLNILHGDSTSPYIARTRSNVNVIGHSSRSENEKCSLFGYRCTLRHDAFLADCRIFCAKMVGGFVIFTTFAVFVVGYRLITGKDRNGACNWRRGIPLVLHAARGFRELLAQRVMVTIHELAQLNNAGWGYWCATRISELRAEHQSRFRWRRFSPYDDDQRRHWRSSGHRKSVNFGQWSIEHVIRGAALCWVMTAGVVWMLMITSSALYRFYDRLRHSYTDGHVQCC